MDSFFTVLLPYQLFIKSILVNNYIKIKDDEIYKLTKEGVLLLEKNDIFLIKTDCEI